MKKLFSICLLAPLLVSCHLFKKSTATRPAVTNQEASKQRSGGFIENIKITPGAQTTNDAGTIHPIELPDEPSTSIPISPEMYYELQFKYAILLDVPVEEMLDHKLIEFLENWYGTRYRMGGTDKSGIDCSAFVQSFMAAMYGISLPRTSKEQYDQSDRIKKDDLQEGDLVFFKTQRRKGISHVGIYLRNNKFVHASTSSGVMISDLSETYFSARYAGCGRYRKASSY